MRVPRQPGVDSGGVAGGAPLFVCEGGGVMDTPERKARRIIDANLEAAGWVVRKRRGGIDFDKLEADCRRLGIREASAEEAAAWKADFEDPAFSRRVLGLDDDG